MTSETLPLFVLPMVLMPGEVQELRVFEPRYRQMLDDCVLDNKNFGLVMNDPFEPTNHWDGPRTHGCEAEILEHETKGSNHFLSIVGRRRFTVEEVIAPALPPFEHPSMEAVMPEEGMFPDLQTISSTYPNRHSIRSCTSLPKCAIMKAVDQQTQPTKPCYEMFSTAC